MENSTKVDSYQNAGVDQETGDALVDWLISEEKQTPHKNRIVSGIGGFASLFRIDFPEMKKPCLVTCTDGVGTKVKLAVQFDRYQEVAQDCVAMCVNDLICTGGRPLLFLDYYASAKLNLKAAQEFLTGLRKACTESDCALVGGETAEMPGVYQNGDFDCAGFAAGVVDEDLRWGEHKVKTGDCLIGISSNGFHSNGYSLLRKVFETDIEKWIETLIRPTHLYVKVIAELSKQVDIHAAAHITGGGIDNIPRVLPKNLSWEMKSWDWPSEFKEVQKRTGMTTEQMLKTLNCGIGFVVILPAVDAFKAKTHIESHGYRAYDLGVLK